MARPVAERRRFDPPPYGPARFNAPGRNGVQGRKIKMRVRGADGKTQIGTLKGASSAERASIELIDENSCGPGVRLRKPRKGKTSQVGQPELRRRLCL